MTVIKGTGGSEDRRRVEKSSIIRGAEVDSASSQIPSSEEAVKKLEESKEKIKGGLGATRAPLNEEAEKELQSARNEAKEIKAQARKEAQEEINKSIGAAKLLAQSKATEAYQKGFEEGKKEGFEAGKKEVADTMLQAQAALEQALIERENLLNSSPQKVARLTLECVKEILDEEIKTNPEIVSSVVKKALEKAKGHQEVAVFVNPEDKPLVEKNTQLFAGFVKDLDLLKIKSDSSIERGGCIIRTDLGTVDARISTQFETLKLAFEQIKQEQEQEPEQA